MHDNLEQGQDTYYSIGMDFSKAFDKVDNHMLIIKLHRLGVTDQSVNSEH